MDTNQRNMEFQRLYTTQKVYKYNINFLKRKIEELYIEKRTIEDDIYIQQDVCLLLTDEIFGTIHKLLYKINYLEHKLLDVETLLKK